MGSAWTRVMVRWAPIVLMAALGPGCAGSLARKPIAPPAPTMDQLLERNYPAQARATGVSGSATVHMQTDGAGKVTVLDVVEESDAAGFGAACVTTLQQGGDWQPALDDDGHGVTYALDYTCTFQVCPRGAIRLPRKPGVHGPEVAAARAGKIDMIDLIDMVDLIDNEGQPISVQRADDRADAAPSGHALIGVEFGADGRAGKVTVIEEHGGDGLARACIEVQYDALTGGQWLPALDDACRPIPSRVVLRCVFGADETAK